MFMDSIFLGSNREKPVTLVEALNLSNRIAKKKIMKTTQIVNVVNIHKITSIFK